MRLWRPHYRVLTHIREGDAAKGGSIEMRPEPVTAAADTGL
jgi:hypothetical protein